MYVPMLVNDFLKRAVVCENGTRLTYREFEARANQLANALRELGVGKGDRVAYLSPNTHHMLEAFYRVTKIGATMVPLNTRLIASDYAYIIDHSGAKVLCGDVELAGLIEPMRDELKTVEHFVLPPDLQTSERSGWISYEPILAAQTGEVRNLPEIDENDIATILYTSGTTGKPKGVMTTHRNLYSNAVNSMLHLRMNDRDVMLDTLPLFHVNGWGNPFSITAMGGTSPQN